jgi:GntR family transcriptional regulator
VDEFAAILSVKRLFKEGAPGREGRHSMTTYSPDTTPGAPLYKDVARRMMTALSDGEWKPGEVIPAEKKLGERFSVSIGTLRKAIDELVANNILVRHQGRGTFVTTHNRDQHMYRFFNVVRHDGVKTYPHVELVSFGTEKANKDVAGNLGVARNAKVIHFTNLLHLGGAPVIVDEIYLPEARFSGMTERQLRERENTLYNLYQLSFGMNVIRIEERLRGGLASPAHAKLLGVTTGAPLLEVHRLAFSFDQMRIEYRISYINSANYEYVSGRAA